MSQSVSQEHVARIVDRVGRAREEIAAMEADIAGDVMLLKSLGSKELFGLEFKAERIRMPERKMIIRAHKQLRTSRL